MHDFFISLPSTFCGIFKAYPGNVRRNWFSWVGKSINKMRRACNPKTCRNLPNHFWLQLQRWLNKPFEKYAPRNGSSPQVGGGENKESLKQVFVFWKNRNIWQLKFAIITVNLPKNNRMNWTIQTTSSQGLFPPNSVDSEKSNSLKIQLRITIYLDLPKVVGKMKKNPRYGVSWWASMVESKNKTN